MALLMAVVLLAYYRPVYAQQSIDTPNVGSTYIAYGKDTLEQKYMNKDTADSKFMKSMEQTVRGFRLTRWLSSSIFVRDKSFADNDSIVKEDFSEYNGKIIRNVNVEGLGPYEVSEVYPDDDTRNWLARLADATHTNTRGFVLRNNRMIKSGDIFDNEMVINNLAHYRSLRYVYDARAFVTLVPGTDFVDVNFVVRDVWSIGINLSRLDFSNLNVELYDRNILGFGTELRTGIYYHRADGSDYLGFRILHSEDNIRGSFIKSRLEIIDRKDRKLRHISFNRNILPNLKTVGGVSYEYRDENHYFITIDTLYKVKNETADVWFGKAFNVNVGKRYGGQNRLAALARYEYRKLRNVMPIANSYYNIYEDRNLYIASLSLFKQQYYTDRLLFAFGVNENIPYGYNITLQAGHENHYYGDMFYTSLAAKFGKQHTWGYTYLEGAMGGYLYGGRIRNGLFKAGLAYFTPLYSLGNQAFRQYVYISYIRGIRRGFGEGNYLSYTEDLLFDLNNDNRKFYGNNNLTISLESDFFSTARLLGFRLAFFNFVDMTWLGNKTSIFANSFLPGVGVGLRIRNDKLVFNTLQLRLGWYPKFPQSGFNDFFDASGIDRFRSNDFIPQKPQTLDFK